MAMVYLVAWGAAMLTAAAIGKRLDAKKAPKKARFDCEAYWKDVNSGMNTVRQYEKRRGGGYTATHR